MFDPDYEDPEHGEGTGDVLQVDPVQVHTVGLERMSSEMRRFKNIPKLTLSPATLQFQVSVTCLVCSKVISSDYDSEQLFPGASSNALVCALSTIFDIPQSFYEQLNLHSLPTPLYCSLCSSLIFNSLEILNNIQSLQSNLEVLKSELKSNLIRSYDDPSGNSNTGHNNSYSHSNGSAAKELIRQSLIQTLSENEDVFGSGLGQAQEVNDDLAMTMTEESPDSLLGLDHDPISEMYTAEEIEDDRNREDEDINGRNDNPNFLDYEDRNETELQDFFTNRSQNLSRTNHSHHLNNILPMTMTSITEIDGNENEDENENSHNATKITSQDIKIMPNQAVRRPKTRGRVKGFLRIRKHRQNGRFPYVCGLCGKGYKKQRSFQMHLMCHTEETKKLQKMNDQVMLRTSIRSGSQLQSQSQSELQLQSQSQAIYDTVLSEVEETETFEFDADPSTITDGNNSNPHSPSGLRISAVQSEFKLPNIPGVEISPAVIKVESQSQNPMQFASEDESNSMQVQPQSTSRQGRFRGILKIRRNRQHRNSAYTCNFCGKGYSNYKSFVRHVKCHRGTVSADPQDLDEEYKDRFRGIFRLSGRQRKGKFRYRCTRCGKGYRNAKSFEIHVKCHSGEYGVGVGGTDKKPVTRSSVKVLNDLEKFNLNPNPTPNTSSSASSHPTESYHPSHWNSSNSGIKISKPLTLATSTSTSSSASQRLKILSNNSKKQAASYRRQFRGIFRIRNRNHGRILPFKCTICGKGYKIARSFETHIKFHTGELTMKKTGTGKRAAGSDNVSSIDTLNSSVNFVNELLSDDPGFLPEHDQDELDNVADDYGDPSVPSSSSTSFKISGGQNQKIHDGVDESSDKIISKRPRGRPRSVAPMRRFRGIFRIRNYGRVGNCPYRCKVCGKGYKNVKSYNTHIVFHSQNGEDEPNDVDDVGAEQQGTDDLSRPAQSRDSIDINDALEVTYVNEDVLNGKKNAKLMHSSPKSIPNGTLTGTGMQLRGHRTESSQSSGSSNSFQGLHQHYCDICEKDFSSSPRLKAHMSYAHSSNSEFHCEKCDMDLPSRPALYQHMQGHLQERQEEKSFKSLSQLGHMETNSMKRRSSSDLRYACNICGERFPQYSNLKEHQSTVHESN